MDLSNRSRLCLLVADRVKFLHGQVTNDINGLVEHTGCYAALVNAKGKMESDLFAYRLAEEILLDFEPGLADAVQARLESFIIAEDVEVADVTPHFGLLGVQGPKAPEVLAASQRKVSEDSRTALVRPRWMGWPAASSTSTLESSGDLLRAALISITHCSPALAANRNTSESFSFLP